MTFAEVLRADFLQNTSVRLSLEITCRICCNLYTGWPTKMSLFFFGNNFYKNKETFKIFSPQLLEVYRILLVKTIVESIMFSYTFSVINTVCSMHCAAVWQHSSNLVIKVVHNSFEHFLWNQFDFSFDNVLSCLWIVFRNSVFQIPPQRIVRRVEILGIGWPVSLMQNESTS